MSLADAGEVVAALAFVGELAQEALHGVLLRGIGGEGEGFAAGEFEEFAVAQRVGDVEAEVAGLAGGGKKPRGGGVGNRFCGFGNGGRARPRFVAGGGGGRLFGGGGGGALFCPAAPPP